MVNLAGLIALKFSGHLADKGLCFVSPHPNLLFPTTLGYFSSLHCIQLLT